jgi:hypothetical protein
VDFEFSHSFDAGAEDVAAVLLDPAFQASLADIGSLEEREVLLQNESEDGAVERRIRCVLDLHVSGAAKKFLGDQAPAWVEEAVWDPDEMRWDWKIVPEIAAELLSASGETVVEQDGAETVRTVAGSIKVKVPLYGGKVEGWIVDGLRAAYDEEADRLAEWLEREK